jgi:hypothetical protein
MRRKACVGVGGGHQGSKAMKRAHSTTTTHVDVEPRKGLRHDAQHAEGGSQPEKQHGLAAEVHMIDRRRENSVRRISVKYFCIRHLLRTAPRSMCFTSPSSSRYLFIDVIASVSVLRALATTHC